MTYLRLVSSDEDWTGLRYAPPPRRRGFPVLAVSLAVLLGLCGAQLILSETRLEAAPIAFSVPRPPPLEPDSPAAAAPRLRIVLTPSAALANHPEAWAVLPTALTAPVVATPLADPRTATQAAAACREAPGLATQMVCVDPVLAAADQQASSAYEAVLAAGASPVAVGRSQARWMLVREEAARSGPEDLLAAYQARTRRLRATTEALARRD